MLFARPVVCVLLLVLWLPATAVAAPVPSHDAAAFRASVGVNTHSTYYGTSYGDWPRVVRKLDELGVGHVRDGIFANPDWGSWNERYYRAVELAASHGIKFDVLMGEPGYRAGSLDQLLAVARGRLRHAIAAIEGPNEYDNFHGGANWQVDVRNYQRELYTKVKADPALRGVPVIAPSLVKPQSPALLGSVENSADFGNIHPYTGGLAPSPAILQNAARAAAVITGSKPLIATEAGYHNGMTASTGQPATSEVAAGSYLLRTYLEHFASGIQRTYAYELLDQKPDSGADPEQNFGLLRHDFSEKPAFIALKNLLQVVGDPAPVERARPLEIGFQGQTAGVQRLLLQRSDRSYALVLWQSASEWDRLGRSPIAVATSGVTVDLPEGATGAVARPSRSAAFSARQSGRLSVGVPSDPVVIDIELSTTPPAVGSTPAYPTVTPPSTGPTAQPPVIAAPAPRQPQPTATPQRVTPSRGSVACAANRGRRLMVRASRSGRLIRATVCSARGGWVRIEALDRRSKRVRSSRVVRVKRGRLQVVTLGWRERWGTPQVRGSAVQR